MNTLIRFLILVTMVINATSVCAAANTVPNGSQGKPASAAAARYPEVVIYTAPWCTSCTAAKEYLTMNSIPFTKKDVSANDAYLEEMEARYKSRAVPIIVIGRDERVLRGFVPEAFQRAVRDVLISRSYAASAGGR
ncbi:MAG TPA: glutaredoxin domain-containing protein [Geobacteraceae bacterium]